MVNIARKPSFGSPIIQPVAPSYCITAVGLPWSPILCSKLTTFKLLETPAFPLASGSFLGTRNKEIPLGPGIASGNLANTR